MPNTISGHPVILESSSPLLRKATLPGRSKIWIRVRRAYLPLFLRLMVLLDIIEPLTMRNTWSFYYRKPRMGTGVSDHDGYAVDCWSDGIGAHTWPSRMPAADARRISEVLERFKTKDGRHVFGWGACRDAPGVVYTGPLYNKHESHDPMHFYVAKGISVLDALRVRRAMRIRLNGTIKPVSKRKAKKLAA